MRACTVLWLGALLLAGAAPAAGIELDDPAARLRATREWNGSDAVGRAGILEAARRERDRYGIGASRISAGVQLQALGAVSNSSFVSVGPTRADFAINGDRYMEIDSGRVRQLIPHPSDPDVLYVSTAGGGVWKTYTARSATVTWEPITDALGTMAVGTLAMDPANPDILFLGLGDPFDVQQPGMTGSTDGGGTWSTPVQLKASYTVGGQTYPLTAGSVTDIKVDPRNSAVVLATTDVGLFRSIDGGASWQHVVVSPAFDYMWSLAYAGDDAWLATGQASDITAPPFPNSGGALGLWRSTDDGLTWTSAVAALPGGDPTAQLAGRATLATAQSTLVEPASTRVYLLTAKSDGRGQHDLFRSDDAGLTFQSLQVNASRAPLNSNPDVRSLDVLRGQAWYNQALHVDPGNPDTVFIGGQFSMVRSTDAGRNWAVLSDWLPNNSENGNVRRPYVHADIHAFAVGADGTFYVGSDGGIAVSPNDPSAGALRGDPASVTFTSARNEGLVTHLVYAVACAPESWNTELSVRDFVAGGLQDNGTRVRDRDTTTFNQVLGGDGIGLALSAHTHLDPRLGAQVPDFFLASVAGAIFMTTDGAQTFQRFVDGLAPLPFFVRIVRDAALRDRFLTFSGSPAAVYKWQYGDSAWVNASGTLHWQDSGRTTVGFTTVDGTQIGLRNLAAHPRRPGVWGAVSNRFTYMTTDAGVNWLVGVQPRPSPASPAGAYQLSSIEFDPTVENGTTYYITSVASSLIDADNKLSRYPADFGHVLRTQDGGLTWESLGVQGALTDRLPAVGVNVVKVDPNDPATLYAGAEIGLYRSTDSGATWSRFGAGTLPLVEVRDLCITAGSQRLTAATYGRGFWQIDTTGAVAGGVRGLGDTNFDSRIDGEDLIDLADGFGATQSSPVYRWQADLVGATNEIDDADLSALLAKFGGRP